ncbi:hypothetical protein NX059_001345 [Plenodomus lindquistii]|nr:hypothetical protein NX059_001345 [Plenodomus lindquistii]
MSKQTSTIAIVGAGTVGATVAYSLIMNPSAGEILLIDPQEDLRNAQVQDLSDATYHGNSPVYIRSGTHKEAGQSDLIVMTAGAAQKQGESRTDLIGKNKAILESAINDMKPFRPDTVLLIVANPVDILTYYAQQYSGLPKSQVFGSGTFLDSARLRGELAHSAAVSASSIDAYVLGEHGDSQFVAWSLATITGLPLHTSLPPNTTIDESLIASSVKNKATDIIDSKGSTNFGIGAVAASICKSVLSDQREVRAVSFFQEELGVCLSMPAVVGRKGVVRGVEVKLSAEEKGRLEESAKALREVMEE